MPYGFPGIMNPQPYSNQNPYTNQQYAQMRASMPMNNQAKRTNTIRVKGLEGARMFPCGPNEELALFDEDSDIFFYKTTDMGGTASLRKFSFQEEPIEEETSPVAPEITHDATGNKLKELESQMLEMQVSLDEILKAVNSNGKQSIRTREAQPTTAG